MLISETNYLNWNKKISAKGWYRIFWAALGIYCILALLVLGIYLLYIGQWQIFMLALAAFVLARGIVSPLIYLAYKRQRPYQKFHFDTVYSRLLSSNTKNFSSFPSDHAISLSSICFVFCWFYPGWIWFLLPIVLLNGWARVVLGYHYISDVLVGWLLGLACGLAVIFWLGPLVVR